MIQDIKKRAQHRTKIIQGQIKGLEKMIENEEYCVDIMTQNLAIQRSLASLNKLLLENHLHTHARGLLRSDNSKDTAQVVDELLSLYELNNIRGK